MLTLLCSCLIFEKLKTKFNQLEKFEGENVFKRFFLNLQRDKVQFKEAHIFVMLTVKTFWNSTIAHWNNKQRQKPKSEIGFYK